MAVLKCKMCGGTLEINNEETVATCEYCGTPQTVPNVDDEKKLKLYERANKLRYNCDFDKAAGAYESIISDYSDEAEAYWGLILCKYGIIHFPIFAVTPKAITAAINAQTPFMLFSCLSNHQSSLVKPTLIIS